MRKGESGFPVTNDPAEVNEVCLILRDLGHLEDCPEWGVCKCAVCNQLRSAEQAPSAAAAE